MWLIRLMKLLPHDPFKTDVTLLDAVAFGTPLTATVSPLSTKIGVETDIRDGYIDWVVGSSSMTLGAIYLVLR